MEHILVIVESITLELKEHKRFISGNDKHIALVDQRLKIAESILNDIKKLQDNDRIESAGRNGGDRVKWAIIGIIGSSAIIGTITLIFNLVEKIGHN
jgi:hypothetical protein